LEASEARISEEEREVEKELERKQELMRFCSPMEHQGVCSPREREGVLQCQNDETRVLEKGLKRLGIAGTKQKAHSKLGPVSSSQDLIEHRRKLAKEREAPQDAGEPEKPGKDALLLDERATDDEDKKATKLDDAEVKVRKWNTRLARKLGRKLTAEMERGMDVLRGFFLRRHKRRMTQSFFGWLHSQPKYKPCGIGLNLVVGLSGVVNPQDAAPGPVYAWTEIGRAICVDWWRDQFKTLRKNLLAGRDALERLSNTTWWDWEDRSRPHH
jgi:hypothetical protein